ncbi:MAG: alpha/beta hydrolase [Planctomycetota bacterium]|nr:alpha/beta hydrolase [Planctomycetota bacterium]
MPYALLRLVLVFGLLAAALGACAGPPKLPGEDGIESLANWKKAYIAGVGPEPVLVETGPTAGGPTRLAVYEGGRERDRVIVFVHGMFTDASSWRFLAGELVADSDVLLVDLPGCGKSDKPTPRAMGEGGYSPDALARRVLRAIAERLAPDQRPQRPRITLVGHSLGAGVCLRLLSEPDIANDHPEIVDRIDRLVLISGMDFTITTPDPAFIRLARISSFEVGLARATGVLDRAMSAYFAEGFENTDYATQEEYDQRRAILLDRPRRLALQGMITDAIPWKNPGGSRLEPDWERLETLEAQMRAMLKPTLILWGSRDVIQPASMAYKLDSLLPRSKLVIYQGGKHSIQMERVPAVAAEIRAFNRLSGPLNDSPRNAD